MELDMTEFIGLFMGILFLAQIVIGWLLKSFYSKRSGEIAARLEILENLQKHAESAFREEAARTRNESGLAARQQRQELSQSLTAFGDAVSSQMLALTKSSGEKLDRVRLESTTAAKELREEVILTLTNIIETAKTTMTDLGHLQKSLLADMSAAIEKLADSNQEKLEAARILLEAKLQTIQAENSKQLELMRQTVDEKLQGTLERRLGDSFKLVSERLELVHQGLGEMQALANGVGDLKKVLSNIKTRGVWGEVQLGMLLEQVLCPEQFEANVSLKDNAERVEYAVKLPGQNPEAKETVWLPIDAKFPLEDYQRLLEAQEKGDAPAVEAAGKQMENRMKMCAKDICRKYLNPPKTTDFGILFLPIEGLFAEVVRRTGLVETLQRDFRVVIAGPTTLWSILNSLQMGFRTLAIQKRSGEVWHLLGAIKTEWRKYGDMLDQIQKKLHSASESLEKAKIRSKSIERKLNNVDELPDAETSRLLQVESRENEEVY